MIFRKPAKSLVLVLSKPINDARDYDYKLLDKPTYLRKPVMKFKRKRRPIAEREPDTLPALLRRMAS